MHATQIVIMIVGIAGVVIMGAWAILTDYLDGKK